MNSLRLSKSSNTANSSKSPSTATTEIPIGIRFNPGEEIIEDIFKPAKDHQLQASNQPLSNSPLQNIEDFNWRKEILQGGFFNRKRSGSIEGNKSGLINSANISSTSPTNQISNVSGGDTFSAASNNLVSNLANSDNSSVGTWKLIKGKVSQAMEDIKSSKTSQPQIQTKEATNEESDGETASINSNSGVTNIDLINPSTIVTPTSTITSTLPSGYNLSSLKTQHKYFGFSRRSNKSDTDSDDENETSVVDDFIESSSLRKSFANLKTKAKTHLSGTSPVVLTNSYKKDNSTLNITDCVTPSTSKILTTAATITSTSTSISTSISSSSSPSLSLGSGIRSTFLRKRTKTQSPDKLLPPSASSTTVPTNNQEQQITVSKIIRRDFEIESGVEMFEDMELANAITKNKNIETNDDIINDNSSQQEGLIISLSTDTITYKKSKHSALYHHNTVPNLLVSSKEGNQKNILDTSLMRKENQIQITQDSNESQENNKCYNNRIKNVIEFMKAMLSRMLINSNFLMTGLLFMILMIAPIEDFFRGIVACMCIITFFNTFSEYFWKFLNEKLKNISVNYLGDGWSNNDIKSNNSITPQRCKFEIPDYSKMSICEMSVIEEHKSLKGYTGWMNEVNNYDPNNFHQSMTRPVYIRLDGSILRILNTSNKIAKRSMWNENIIDRKNIIFTCSRTFNLAGARVQMLPRGLARKRYFSKKYPLQLIIKNKENQKSFPDDESPIMSCVDNMISKSNVNDDFKKLDKNENISINKILREENQIINSSTNEKLITGSNTLPSDNNVIHQNSNESYDELRNDICSDIQINDLDFGATLLNSDLQKLQDLQDPIALKETIPCGDETRILLFARCDREKEDWYRRFYAASIGAIHDQDLKIPDMVMITDEEVSQALKTTSIISTELPKENSNQTNETLKNDTSENDNKQPLPNQNSSNNTPNLINSCSENTEKKNSVPIEEASVFEGLLFSADAARNPPEYIKFMARYQNVCTQNKIPVVKSSLIPNETPTKRTRRQKIQEDELWKGINQSLYLGPSGSIVWANVLIGRILFSCLNDNILLEKIQDFLQRKLSAIRLPSFMEDVSIAHIHLGDTPPLIHRISQPHLDERGTWVDADVTYEGLVHMTITTKLNLLRLKRSQHGGGVNSSTHLNIPPGSSTANTSAINISRPSCAPEEKNAVDRSTSSDTIAGGSTTPASSGNINTTIKNTTINVGGINSLNNNNITSAGTTVSYSTVENGKLNQLVISTTTNVNNTNLCENEMLGSVTNLNSDSNDRNSLVINSAIYDSNAESSGASSSESESPTTGSAFDISSESQSFHSTPGSSRRFLRIVDRITASNIFQSATEISYIQRAMENMSTKITLRVELKGLVSRVVFNIPPPPSDRIWLAFRGPPRLWISAKPAVGDHAFDWSVVTNVIENKLCDEVYKYLVYPNMVDIIVPFLGQSTYKE